MRVILIVAVVVAFGPLVTAQAPPNATDLARRVQAHYDQVRDFTADFTQSQTSGVLPQASVERGTVKVKKPNLMRWVYTAPEKKEFIADGVRMYSYFPADKYVMISPLPKEGESSTALLFLSGRGSLVRDFTSDLASEQPDGEWHLILVPNTKQDFSSLTLAVDRRTLAMRGLTVRDDQGGVSTFRFNDLQENRHLPDRDFLFKVPKGVEIR
jgi:outer membrane lipoprotein carrier protein